MHSGNLLIPWVRSAGGFGFVDLRKFIQADPNSTWWGARMSSCARAWNTEAEELQGSTRAAEQVLLQAIL